MRIHALHMLKPAERRDQQAAETRKQLAPARRALEKVEKAMAEVEGRIATVEASLADSALYDAGQRDSLQALLLEQGQLRQRLQAQG